MTFCIGRRAFITLLGGAAATWPLAARAQQAAKRPLIVCLVGGSKAGTERFFGGFSQGMRELGYLESRDYSFEVRRRYHSHPAAGGRAGRPQARRHRVGHDGWPDGYQEINRHYTDRLASAH